MRPPARERRKSDPPQPGLPKCPTGIHGLDEITLGGLPRGRPTLVCGGPGCGKTLLGMEFLVRGATEFNEPGVCVSFEETAEELSRNVASLGFDVDRLIARKKLAIDYVFIERSMIEEAANMTWRRCSSGSAMPSIRWERNDWCSTASNRCSRVFRTSHCCAPNSGACSAG